jgi:hypothetical protein
VYSVVELAALIPLVVTPGLAVVVDTPIVVTFGIIVVVLDVVIPVKFAKSTELKTVNGQKFGSRIGLDCGPQNSVPVTTPLKGSPKQFIRHKKSIE